MFSLRIAHQAQSIEELFLPIESDQDQSSDLNVVVEIAAAGVNMSDVKAAMGAMPKACWPRTPGRDFAGTVVDGPSELVGLEVWGTGGDLGITRDGSHASHLILPRDALVPKPANLTFLQAGALGVPFVTAYEGLCRCGLPKKGDAVVVFGANGKVGQAVIQIASMLGAQVFGVEREREEYAGHASTKVRMLSAYDDDIAGVIREETLGLGANVVFNTVGSVYFDVACRVMGASARQVFIATIDKVVSFDIFSFYRSSHSFFGVDTLSLNCKESAKILFNLYPHFEAGELRPFPVDKFYALTQAHDAYREVYSGGRDRVVLVPKL